MSDALREALREMLALVEDMSRFVGQMALKDYQRFNEAPIKARAALASQDADSQGRAERATTRRSGEVTDAITFLTKWADDINKSSGPSVDADSLRSIADLLKRVDAHAAIATASAPAPPYPFCRTPEKCAGNGYCKADPACNE